MSIAHVILISIPLFFSHIFSRVGVVIGEESSFERMKVYLFLALVVLFLGETLIHRRKILVGVAKKWWLVLTLFLFIPLITGISLGGNFLFGSYEKHHGYLFWLILIIFFICINTLSDKKSLIRTSLFTSGVVTTIGILEFFGWTLMGEDGDTSWGAWRIISTLGNPNYVAGYLLIHLPLIPYLKREYQSYIFGLIIVGILLTGSYIAIALMVIYGLAHLARRFHKNGPLLILLLAIITISGVWQILPEEKKLSFETRGVLMVATLEGYARRPQNMLTGYGPDSIIIHFSGPRSERVQSYIGDTYIIDSSHSIFIDILYSYGMILFLLLSWILIRVLPTLETTARDGLILGLIFFGLNVIVLAPLLVIILLGTVKKS